ncbi:MAG: hypothetical protein JWP63_3577 [Candidatus Solibacter sp.]|nr:hypothetical protein [Candidatus Solibacter sp.]
MEINSDYRDLLRSLNAAGVRYLVIGGYAVMAYTEPRYTKDLDIWVEPEAMNAAIVFRALAEFGAPLQGITAADFAESDIFYQLGTDPVRIDVLTSVAGVAFASAWERRVIMEFSGEPCPVLGREDLIAAKRAIG